jgi:tetratricopeptide (TPR) repeat protein
VAVPLVQAVGGLPTGLVAALLAVGQPTAAVATSEEARYETDGSAAVALYRAMAEKGESEAREIAILRLSAYNYTIGDYESALGFAERIGEGRLTRRALRWKALSLFALGRFEEAALAWSVLLELGAADALSLEARSGHADCLWHLGRREKAAEEYLELTESDGASPLPSWPLYRLAGYHVAQGRGEVGWEFYRMVADRYPATPEAAMARAILSSLEQEAGVSRFAVQVGAFSQAANAERLRKTLEEAGHEARVVPVVVGDTRLSAVRVGRFVHEGDALDLREALQREMGLEGRVVEE